MKNRNKASLSVAFFIGITLVDFMGLGIVVTLFPKLLLSNDLLPIAWSHSTKLTLLGLFLAIYPLGQFIGAAILGKLSDFYGRKKILSMSLLGTLACFLVSGYAIVISAAGLLFISRFIAGLFAGNVAIAQAGLVDVSVDEKTKNRNFSLLQVALGGSWVIGPPMGGWLSQISYSTPFWVIAGLLTILIIVNQFWFKETLQNPSTEKSSVFSGLTQITKVFSLDKYRAGFAIWFIFVCGWWLFEAFLPTYLQQQFHFTPNRIGDFLATMGGTYVLFQLFIVQRFTKAKPQTMVKRSLVFSGVAVLGLAFVNTPIGLHLLITLFVCAQGFALPGLIVSISSLANEDEQGEMMGMISSIQAIATVAMMMIGGWLDSFGLTVSILGGGLLLILAWALFTFHFSNKKIAQASAA